MEKELIDTLTALRTAQKLIRQYEPNSRPGGLKGGVGYVRVDCTNTSIWIVVAINDLPDVPCLDCRHNPNMDI